MADRDGMMEQASLTHISNYNTVLAKLKQDLMTHLAQTFGRLDDGTNPHVQRRRNGQPRFTETNQEPAPSVDIDLYPQDRFVPIYEVLHFIKPAGTNQTQPP